MIEVYSNLTERQQYNLEEGQFVIAMYLGQYKIQGMIVNKRAKYGVKNQYMILLGEELVLPFKSEAYPVGTMLSVDHDQVVDFLVI